jgi:hypothetical protein
VPGGLADTLAAAFPRERCCLARPRVRDWLLRNARLIAAAIMVLLAAVLLRDGISGLSHMS